ncbi:MAG: cytochrome c biogenesis protein CcsA [Phycisphaeraceae bacterium]|nr:cytochrome c biogenesis protein CcsA [Phycisphaeraceae bacterium]
MKQVLAFISSLRLTVVLFAMALFVILAGTLAQVDQSIWQVLEQYFRTPLAWIEWRIFFPRTMDAPGGFYFPGGWLIAAALLVNLLAAHAVRFRIKARGSMLVGGLLIILAGAALTWWIIFRGSQADLTARTLNSYWRILYQLLQGSAAAGVLLLGCLMLFRGRAGIVLLHAGIILLIVSELITGTMAVEATLTLREGETGDYIDVSQQYELALIDTSDPNHDAVTVVPDNLLQSGEAIRDERLPAEVRVLAWWDNTSNVIDTTRAPMVHPDPRVDSGLGRTLTVLPQAGGAGMVDAPAAIVSFIHPGTGESLGTYLLSLWFDPNFNRRTFDGRQTLKIGNQTYTITLRPRRVYLRSQENGSPYRLTLKAFHHDVYPGTSTPRNFASDVLLNDPAAGIEDRPVRIWMNNPMRYGGRIFYQSAFLADDSGTVLQVVRNAGWMTPYVACMIVAVGLLWHFAVNLLTFTRKRASNPSPSQGEAGWGLGARAKDERPTLPQPLPKREGGQWIAPAVLVLAGTWLIYHAYEPAPRVHDFNFRGFGDLPVMYEGRVQPVDTLARNALRILSGRQTYRDAEGKRRPAVQWLLEAFTGRDANLAVLRIESLDLQQALGLEPRRGFRYAAGQIKPQALDKVFGQAQHAADLEASQRDRFDRQALHFIADQWLLRQRLIAADSPPHIERPGDVQRAIAADEQLHRQSVPLLVPPPPTLEGGDAPWRSVSRAGLAALVSTQPDPRYHDVIRILAAYAQQDAAAFNGAVAEVHKRLIAERPPHYEPARVRFEAFFNHAAPFYQCAVLYVLAFLLTAVGWLVRPRELNRAATWLLLLTFLVHTAALIGRIYISGRPPVTNLYSSAVFIGWAAVGTAMLLERIFRNGAGNTVAAIAGFATLLIAHFLAGDGDTFVVLQAVLDTNFWLATHVVSITLGYSATFLAGLFALLFVLRGVFTKHLDEQAERELARMIYGCVCFALLFSFVGTVLGGLWADDSWGRFWGWDPKENGALMIVIWNALILHARWSGMVRQRGLAALAIFGNIVTAWSWFGVNQLSVGLHSYGFTDAATLWLLIFVNSQLVLIAVSLMPRRYWASAR